MIVLSVRHAEEEKARLLDLGADDFVTKPFSLRELDARVRAQLRRSRLRRSKDSGSTVRVANIEIDLANRRVTRDGARIGLTPIEWLILKTFVEDGRRTVTHRQLFARVWGQEYGDPKQLIRFHITNLRRKIELSPTNPQVIVTKPGVAYRAEVDG